MAAKLVARNGGRAGIAALAAILLLGLGLRAGYAWEGRAPVFDAAAYGRIAANLERGEGFTLGKAATQPASNYSPGLPLLVGGLYKLSGGAHERFARLVLAVLGSLSVLFTYLIGRRLSGPGAGLLGAAAVAIYPALLEYQGMLMGEPLATTLLSGAILAMLWAADAGPERLARGSCHGGRGSERTHPSADPLPPRHPRERWLLPGALLGTLALVRPEYLAIAVLLAVAVALTAGMRQELRPQGLVSAGTLLLGVALVVAPWAVRNAIALDRFVPVSTGGGQVLFAGAYMPSGGDPERVGREVLERHPGLTRKLASRYLPPTVPGGEAADLVDAVLARVRLEQILAALATQRFPDLETDRALARMGRERLWDDIADEPLGYAGFIAAKVGRTWFRGPRDVMRRPAWEILHWALLALGLIGLIALARRRRWEALLLATVIVAIAATGALLVASPRRALVAMPLLAALAGAGGAWLSSCIGPRRSA